MAMQPRGAISKETSPLQSERILTTGSQAAAPLNNQQKRKKAVKLSAEEQAQLKEAFQMFDKSGDGKIDANEL